MNHSRHSIVLLGNQTGESLVLARYHSLIREFEGKGEFLSPIDHSDWLRCYDRDSQPLQARLPLLVFRPHQLTVISPFIIACQTRHIPLTTRCGGTGLSGATVPSQGGVILLTGHFRAILKEEMKQGEVIVEPGVTPRQLNQRFHHHGWYFPLQMMTEGVAGLAGCLSSQAYGYHQSAYSLLGRFLSVRFIDAKGEEIEAPASLLAGAEGLFGVIIQLRVKLERIPQRRMVWQVRLEWESFLNHLEAIQQLSVLKSIVWHEQSFFLILEGDEWRMKGALRHLENVFNSLSKLPEEWQFRFRYPPPHHLFILLSHALPIKNIRRLIASGCQLCEQIGLKHDMWANVQEGSLHLLLFSEEEIHSFNQKIERFLVAWVHVLKENEGTLISRHGSGTLLSPYLPPFFREEDFYFLQKLRQAFDPDQLFNPECFFPIQGKSLERVRHHENRD